MHSPLQRTLKRLAIALLFGGLLIAAVIFAISDGHETRATVSQSAAPEDLAEEITDSTQPSAEVQPSQQVGSGSRIDVRAQARILVVDERGDPVEGALVWRLNEDAEWVAPADTATDATGAAPLLGDDIEGLGVWVTHGDFQPSFSSLSESPTPALVLTRGTATPVLVIQVDGSPFGSAIIHQELLPLDSPVPVVPFIRTFSCDREGRVLLRLASEPQTIWATSTPLISAPWSGSSPPEDSITLTIRATVSAFGAISSAEGFPGTPEGSVKCFAWHEEEWILLAGPSVHGDAWGPVELPWIEGADYGFKLVGDELLVSFQDIGPTQVGSKLQVDFTAEPGITLVVILLDTDDQPIEGATVSAAWSSPGTANSASTTATTDATGTAHLKSVRPGTVVVHPTRDGFVSVKYGPIQVPLKDEDSLTINLEAAGVISGTCTLDGVPQENFAVVYWQGHPHSFQREYIRGSKDGRFEVSNTPLGEVLIYAISDACPQGDTQRVLVASDQRGEVLLELSKPITGYGKVLALATGEPIAGASIQLWSATGTSLQTQRDKAYETEPDGTFRIPGFTVGSTRFIVSAPGFAYSLCQAFAEPGRDAHVGTITLERHQRITVALHSEDAVDFTDYTLRGRGVQNAPLTDFSAEGIAVLSEAVSGVWKLTVFGPDEFEIYTEVIVYPREEEWIVDVSIDTSSTLEVLLSLEEPDLEPGWLMSWSNSSLQGLLHNYARAKDGRATFKTLGLGPVFVMAYTDDWKPLGAAATVIKPGLNTLELPLEHTTFGVRLLDSEGAGIPNTTINVQAPADNHAFSLGGVTDETGRVEFVHPPYTQLEAILNHPDIGYATGIPIELSGTPGEEHVIVMPDRVGLRCRLVDQGVALPGIRVRVMAPDRRYIMAFFSSDDEGLIEGPGYCEGNFLVMVDQARYWSSEMLVRCTDADEPVDIQVHRLADVTFDVRSTSGLTVRGRAVQLHSLEFDTDVAAWIAEGLVSAPGGMVTDSAGQLELTGLPRGDYRWRVVNSAGVATEGLVTLVAWSVTPVGVLLD